MSSDWVGDFRHSHELWGCRLVSGTRVFYSGSSGSCMLGGGACMDPTCSSSSYRCSIRLGSGEFGGPVNTLGPLLCSSSCSWAVCSVSGHIVLLGGHCHRSVVMRGFTWSTTVFGWVVRVKWQHPRFPSRTSHCDEMINVIHVTCQWFECCDWSVYLCKPPQKLASPWFPQQENSMVFQLDYGLLQ